MGADIPDSTLVDWCRRAMKGRIWTYVRDQRPWAGGAPPGAVYYFAPDWKEDHFLRHLRQTSGILQADGYKGYGKLYEPGADGTSRFREAACWAHWRRDFHDIWTSNKSEIAREALDRIGALYDIEHGIAGQPADARLAARQKHSKPKIGAFRVWIETQLTRIPGKSDLAKAFRYGLSRWPSFCLFLEDGRVAMDNNAAERALRPIAKTDSLCTPSSNGGKQRFLIIVVDDTRRFARQIGLDPFIFKVAGADLVGRPAHDLLGWQYAVPDEPADFDVRHAKLRGRVRHGKPLAVLVGRPIAADLVHRAQGLDASRRPGLSLTRLHAHAVECGGNFGIRPSRCHGSHDRQSLLRRTLAMLSGFGLANPYLGMLAPMPMDGQDHIARVVIDVRHNVLDERAQQLLTAAHIDTRRIPGGFEILARPVKSGTASTGSIRWTSLSRASQVSTRLSVASQVLSSWAAISRFSGSQAA